MENRNLPVALTGMVPSVCDAEAGEEYRDNLAASQASQSEPLVAPGGDLAVAAPGD